jgi:GTP 3',8-cyclase
VRILDDKYGRSFKKLRVSLTDSCNLACKYCVPEGLKAEELLGAYSDTTKTIETIQALKNQLGLEKIRFTGGEPLLHKGIVKIIAASKSMGFEEIAITSNGLGVSDNLIQMIDAGLDSINISLDASNATVFESITGFNRFEKVMKALDKCKGTPLKVKLNTVILKGMNEDEILPLLDYAQNNKIEIRFLELMKMGKMNSYFDHYFYSAEEIKNNISRSYTLKENGRPDSSTTRYYQLENGYKFGIIENESTPFCKDCDRLRLGSDLKLYGCITATEGIEVLDVLGNEPILQTRLQSAMNQKQDSFIGSVKSMIKVGG